MFRATKKLGSIFYERPLDLQLVVVSRLQCEGKASWACCRTAQSAFSLVGDG